MSRARPAGRLAAPHLASPSTAGPARNPDRRILARRQPHRAAHRPDLRPRSGTGCLPRDDRRRTAQGTSGHSPAPARGACRAGSGGPNGPVRAPGNGDVPRARGAGAGEGPPVLRCRRPLGRDSRPQAARAGSVDAGRGARARGRDRRSRHRIGAVALPIATFRLASILPAVGPGSAGVSQGQPGSSSSTR